jgi:hypothetical protein
VSVPTGFYEKVWGEFDHDLFVRARFLRQDFVDAEKAQGRDPFFDNERPRWTLYGGPMTVQRPSDTHDFHVQLDRWARDNGLIFYWDDDASIVPHSGLPWPHQDFRWQWVWEPGRPAKVEQVWNRQLGRPEWQWVRYA